MQFTNSWTLQTNEVRFFWWIGFSNWFEHAFWPSFLTTFDVFAQFTTAKCEILKLASNTFIGWSFMAGPPIVQSNSNQEHVDDASKLTMWFLCNPYPLIIMHKSIFLIEIAIFRTQTGIFLRMIYTVCMFEICRITRIFMLVSLFLIIMTVRLWRTICSEHDSGINNMMVKVYKWDVLPFGAENST